MRNRPARKERSAGDKEAAARMLEILRTGGDVRRSKIARIKSSISQRAYESSLKIEIAIDHMLEGLRT